MSPAMRVLSLAARLPATLLPFAAALGLVTDGALPALGAGVSALMGYWAAQALAPVLLKMMQARNMLLCTTVLYVVLTVVLIVAVEQNMLWTSLLLSGLAGCMAPPERSIAPNRRLERTAVGLGFFIALGCGLASAWSVPLVAAAFVAATAAPLLLMTRTTMDRKP